MGKPKSKKLAKHTPATPASTASSRTLEAPNSPRKPLRPSKSIRSDPANATESLHGLRDGPASPVAGGVNGRSSSAVLAHSAGKESTQRKKRKLENDGKASGAIASEHKYGGKKARRTDLELLYEPWLLLPASLRSAVANSLTSWEDRIVPVVFTRNQNIKAGINKLKAYMGDDQSRNATAEEKLWAERLAKGDALLAVSAQAEATTKLVGIIGMAKRILAPSENQPGAEGDTWYSYTSLSSQVMQKRNPDKAARKEDAKDDDPFDSLADIQTQDSENSRSMLTVPLLTVWVSRARIPPFRDAFGEQTFRVAQMNGHG